MATSRATETPGLPLPPGATSTSAEPPVAERLERSRRETVARREEGAPEEGAPREGVPPEPPRHIGRYEVRGELGRGGAGVVYDVWDPQLGRPLALKTLIAGRDATQTQIDRFLREVKAAAQLRHPHIVSVHDAGLVDGRLFLAMDRIEGKPLDQVLDEEGRLAPRRAVELLLPIVRALDHAHAQGFVHRDVKPENVLVDREGHPYLTDFGLALDLSASQRLTQTNQSLGTPVFMAPEQLRGRAVDPRADIYSVGATLYECLTGRVPFQGDSFPELLNQILVNEPPPLRALAPHVAPDLEAIVLVCLEKDPARRYPTPGELARDLERFLAGEAVHARAPGLWRRLLRRARRSPRLSAALAALALSTAVALGAGMFVWQFYAQTLAENERLAKDRDRLERAVEEAVRRYEQEDARRRAFSEAALATTLARQVEAYDQLLARHPDSWEGRVIRARLLRELGRGQRVDGRDAARARRAFLRAAEDLDRALESTNDSSSLLLLKAELLRADLDDLEAARDAYEQLARVGDEGLALYARARRHAGQHQWRAALELLDRALERRADLAPARLLRAEALLRTGDVAGALGATDRASSSTLDEAERLRLRAEARMRAGQVPGALADALRALELDPEDAEGHLVLALVELARGDPAAGLAAARRALDRAPSSPRALLAHALAALKSDARTLFALAVSQVQRARELGLREGLLHADVLAAVLEAERRLDLRLDPPVRASLGL